MTDTVKKEGRTRTKNHPVETDGRTVTIDSVSYPTQDLSDVGKDIVMSLDFVTIRMQENKKKCSVLLMARQVFIDVIKREVIQSKGGLILD
jgi:hypothetical protein